MTARLKPAFPVARVTGETSNAVGRMTARHLPASPVARVTGETSGAVGCMTARLKPAFPVARGAGKVIGAVDRATARLLPALLGLLLPLFCLFGSSGCGGSDPVARTGVPPDYQGLQAPAQTYGALVTRLAGFLMSDKGEGGIREEDGEPVPPYFYSFGICDARNEAVGCDAPDQLTIPVSFPAYTCAVAIEALSRYYVYSGNPEALDRATHFARWVLRHLTPETDTLPGLPYSTQAFGGWGGGMDGPSIELDKAAMFAVGLLRLHDLTADAQFLEAATRIARTLLGVQKEDGSWAFRVIPASGGVYRDYTSDQIPFVKLMSRMYELTGEQPFLEAGERAWQWLLEHPVTTMHWANFYEDMDDPGSLVNFDAMETVRELLRRRTTRPEYLSPALAVFNWVEQVFLLLEAPYPPLIPSIAEQTGFVIGDTPAGTSSSTAQWASLGLGLFRATGDSRVLRHALEAANVVASAQQPDGRMYTVTADVNGAGLYPLTWYEQCFVPLWFMLEVMAERPELAPEGENHLLDWSGAAPREVSYGDRAIRYVTGGAGHGTVKVRGRVLGVTVAGRPLPEVRGLGAGTRGWAFDPKSRLLNLGHPAGPVVVRVEPPGPRPRPAAARSDL